MSATRSDRRLAEALLQDWLEAQAARLGLVGVAAGALLPGGESAWAAHGFADRERGLPIGPQTPLRLASVTKLFTATALLVARDRGLLSLEAPAGELVPALRAIAPDGEVAPITLRQCASHTAGLPLNLPEGVQYWDRSEPEMSFPPAKEAVEWLRDLRLVSAPMTSFHYSNVGYLIIGLALEAAFGQDYEQLVREHVLDPLGMADAFFGAAAELDRLAPGYRPERGELPPAPRVDVGWDTAGGGLCCSAAELARFASFQLGGPGPELHPSSLLEARQPVLAIDSENATGLGWRLRTAGGHTFVHHSGGIAGYSACIVLAPELELGAVLLSNTMSFQTTPLLEGIVELLAGAARTERALAEPPAPAPAPAGADGLTGRYENTEIAVEVLLADGGLVLVSGGRLEGATRLTPTDSRDRFLAESGEAVIFRGEVDGRFTELAMQGLLFRRSRH